MLYFSKQHLTLKIDLTETEVDFIVLAYVYLITDLVINQNLFELKHIICNLYGLNMRFIKDSLIRILFQSSPITAVDIPL